MKTKSQFFKENIIVSIILNLPILFIVISPFNHILDTLYLILGAIIILLALSINSIEKWYLEEKLEYFEKRIKQLENK